MDDKIKNFLKNFKWLGHDTFLYDGKVKIYFDPYQLMITEPKADIILTTHPHFDHFSKDDIMKIKKDKTNIVATPDSENLGNTIYMKPYETKEILGFKIQSVPAYNTNKEFHPKKNNWLGYIIEIEGLKIYHAGDTDNIPEMKDYKCDIALLPVSGTYVMTSDEAVDAAIKINPKLAIPMHFGAIVGSKKDAENFKKKLEGKIEVIILEKV
jgi:L-ascorbate metabolism protein UlaG (beta-lactamase superfamily)|uniref:MBL fold metallo-hydrolase n=1 Tax=candidate division WOR-3 bacterium TaxID=2052148 RepID=A0A7C4U976_UNCW3